MPDQMTNYQCLACGGPLHFDGASGKLQCDYCGSAFTTGEVEAFYAAKDATASQAQRDADAKKEAAQADAASQGWDMSGLSGDWGADAEGMKAYNCPSCGAELICDATTAATQCPYCGNPTIVPGQFVNDLKPDFVIPFKLDREAAKKALRAHYKGKPFLPRAFTAGNHIEKIQGVYVPFWLFDGTAQGTATWEATRSSSHREGDYEVTETQHFRVSRSGSQPFANVPVDGSSKMEDDYMDSIEPFDYQGLQPFSTAFLPGYLADKYDVTAQDSAARADKRCGNSFKDALRGTVTGYDTCVETGANVQIQRGTVHYALMPVWVLNTKWNGKDYKFMMNGQTGRLIGDLPVSMGRFWGTFAWLTVLIDVILSLVYFVVL